MNELQIRLVAFSVEAYRIAGESQSRGIPIALTDQLIRAASSVGANYAEAQSAASKRDFHNKVRIALKEMQETKYWLLFLKGTRLISGEIEPLLAESDELLRILSTIAKKTDPKKQPRPPR